MSYSEGAPVRITAPTRYTGTVVGVDLIDGIGETDNPAAISYFRRHGYQVDNTAPQQEPAAASPPRSTLAAPSRSARKADWVDYAVSRGMTRDEAEVLTRDELARRYLEPEG